MEVDIKSETRYKQNLLCVDSKNRKEGELQITKQSYNMFDINFLPTCIVIIIKDYWITEYKLKYSISLGCCSELMEYDRMWYEYTIYVQLFNNDKFVKSIVYKYSKVCSDDLIPTSWNNNKIRFVYYEYFKDNTKNTTELISDIVENRLLHIYDFVYKNRYEQELNEFINVMNIMHEMTDNTLHLIHYTSLEILKSIINCNLTLI